MASEIRDIFLRYMINIFKDYEYYLHSDNPECSINNVMAGFDKDKFLKD